MEESTHKKNNIQSNICVSMLCKISEFINVKNNEIFIKNENLIIDGKKMLVYNIDSLKKRRKSKKEYDYFNPYTKRSHYKFLINTILEIEDIEGICIEGDKISFYFQNEVIINDLDNNLETEEEKVINTLINFLDV